MVIFLAVLAAAFLVFVTMIAIIFGAGVIEGRKRPEQQDRPYEGSRPEDVRAR